MSKRSLLVITGLIFAASLADGATASPPPPPPSFIDDLAKQLIVTPSEESFASYARILAEDVTVSINGKQIAANKAAWIIIERHRLSKVDRDAIAYAEGYDSILVIDRFDDRSDLMANERTYDPRYKTRAVRYEVGADHLIHAIRIVETDGFPRAAH